MSENDTKERESSLRLTRQVIEQVTEHARAEWPNECCGLLLGSDERIDEAIPARNLRASPSRFLVDPVDHLAAVRRARATGHRVAGAYHSHPDTPPVPSPRDLDEATYTELVYLICGPVRQAGHGPIPVRAWCLADEAQRHKAGRPSFVELPIVVIG